MHRRLLGAGEGETLVAGASRIELKATAETTGGAFTLSETTVEPGFSGPPPHTHAHMHDAFYVLEGTLTLRLNDETHEAPVGTFTCVCPGTVHTFANHTDAPVRFLNLQTPGGWEAYLRELAEALSRANSPDPAVMGRIASRYDFQSAT